MSGLQVWFVVYKRAVAVSLTAPYTSVAGISTPVGTEVKGAEASAEVSRSDWSAAETLDRMSRLDAKETRGPIGPLVTSSGLFFLFLIRLKRWFALATTQSQKSGQRVLRSYNPVVHSRNEPGWGKKADWGRGQGRPSRPEGMDVSCDHSSTARTVLLRNQLIPVAAPL
jgi:hypothetical protein